METIIREMFNLINSSSGIDNLLIGVNEIFVAGSIDIRSVLRSDRCRIKILNRIALPVFICDGEVSMERMEIYSRYDMGSIFESQRWSGGTMGEGASSRVEVKQSLFRDIRLW